MKKYFAFMGLVLLSACSEKSDLVYKVNPEFSVSLQQKMSEASISFNKPKIDIVWIIDNSGSMSSVQNSVIQNTSSFIRSFTQSKNIDWKMGVLSTDINDTPYLGFNGDDFTFSSPGDPILRFQSAVARLGITGAATERSFDPLVNNLKSSDFIREGAYLAVIFVTDEREQSSAYSTAQQVISELLYLKDNNSSLLMSAGVFSSTDWGLKCNKAASYDTDALRYKNSEFEKFLTMTSGTYYDTCNPNFGTLLSNLGQNLVNKISKLVARFVLAHRPVISSIKLTYKGEVLPAGAEEDGGVWTYDPAYNVIVIHDKDIINGDIKDVLVEYVVNPDQRDF